MNKQQAIEQVNASVGSLFSKSDVLAIINSLETAPASTDAKTSELIEKMRTRICSVFARMTNEAWDVKIDEFAFMMQIKKHKEQFDGFLDELQKETEEETEEETEI